MAIGEHSIKQLLLTIHILLFLLILIWGGVFEVFVNAAYDGFYNFDAARLSNTSIRVRCFRSGIQQTSGNVQISILVIK